MIAGWILLIGCEDHFQSRGGGSKDAKDIANIKTHITRFLVWAHFKISIKYGATTDALEFGNQLMGHILRTPTLISVYSNYLSCSKGFSCSTVLNHLRGIRCVVTYLSLHCTNSHITVIDCLPFENVIENLNRVYCKLLRAERSSVGSDTIEGAVFNGLLPSGGIADLQRVCNEDKEWALHLRGVDCDERKNCVVVHYQYKTFDFHSCVHSYYRIIQALHGTTNGLILFFLTAR